MTLPSAVDVVAVDAAAAGAGVAVDILVARVGTVHWSSRS